MDALVIALLALLVKQATAATPEERLYDALFANPQGYNRLIRPVRNTTECLDVQFGMALIQIVNVDEKNQILKTNIWERYLWHDYQLTWDPADYEGVNSLRVSPDNVWLPDIVLFNNADGNYEVSYKCNVVLFPDGSVLWVPPAIFQSSCTMNVEYFPFDMQKCEMKFGSWTFNKDQVKLSFFEGKDHVDLNDYQESGTWDIIELPGCIDNLHSKSATMTFHISIRRRTLFYTINLVVPCLLLSLMSVLVFYLPVDCGEKMTLAISLLLALVVFLLLVQKILPATSLIIPLVAKYLLFTMIMNIITILVTVIIINWNFRAPTTHSMPNWAKKVFVDTLPVFLCIRRPLREAAVSEPAFAISCFTLPNNGSLLDFTYLHHPKCKHVREERDDVLPTGRKGIRVTEEGRKTMSAIDYIAERLRAEDIVQEFKDDWQYIAMVIDRLLLYVFFAVTASGTASIILKAPDIFANTIKPTDYC
ncbi:PREDICTED: acetylcholine receptor subunit beta-like 1 [Priapulus caudatus]|uniref:Acetylcholine receptor subunit beta-like 1 n=1 Tax=Priapulus caudatus TaxID=37621 RepID=A0ABM1E2X2_PRICU|nr:PREDICTED: acetylcholine receptor subunit beta-like 1 [Priapulus caudatus]